MPVEHASGGLTFAVRGQQGAGTKAQLYTKPDVAAVLESGFSIGGIDPSRCVPRAKCFRHRADTGRCYGELPLTTGSNVSDVRRIIVLSPWGAGGGYSGPLTLLDRLFGSIKRLTEGSVRITLIARDRGSESLPAWADEVDLITSAPGSFGIADQVRWALAARKRLAAPDLSGGLVHLHGAYLPNKLAVLGLREDVEVVTLPVLADGDLASPGKGPARVIKKLLNVLTARRTDAAIALSESIAQEFRGLGVDRSAITLIGNAVVIEKYVGTRVRDENRVRLGFVGKLGPVKRPHLILDSLIILRASGCDARAIFVGPFASPDYEAEFRARMEASGLEGAVELVDFTEDPSENFNNDMDIFVLPSSSEGLPGALTEAMAASLPCIVTDVGGMAAAVTTAGAGVVVEGSGESIAAAARTIIQDGDVERQMQRAARRAAETLYATDVVAETYLRAIGLDPERRMTT